MILSRLAQYWPATFLTLVLLLGGASLAGQLGNFLIQMLALGVIIAVVCFRPQADAQPSAAWRGLRNIATLALFLLVLTLLPLPPALWTNLPGRERVAEAFALIGAPLPWLPISLAPADTIWSALSFLPVAAMALITFRAHAQNDQKIQATIVLFGLASAVLGIFQVVTGLDSPLYLYDVTNRGLAVGFFANANHLATLMAVTIVQSASFMAGNRDRQSSKTARTTMLAVLVLLDLILLAAAWLTDSITGQLLCVVAVAASPFIYRQTRISRTAIWLGLGTAVLSSVAIFGLLANSGTLANPHEVQAGTARQDIYPRAMAVARDHLPLGSGLGSFAATYRAYENPATVNYVYANHAHSDVLELIVETGLLGLALMLAMLFWFGRQVQSVLDFNGPHAHRARAAMLCVVLVAMHSVVDYPLRTAAMATLTGAWLAMIARRSWIES